MSKSLQDQLLKAGLVDAKKAKSIKKEKNKKNKQRPKGQVDEPTPEQLAAARAIEEKRQKVCKDGDDVNKTTHSIHHQRVK